MNAVVVILKYLWALPWTLFGIAVGALGLVVGGGVQWVGGVVEFHGRGAEWFLKSFPLVAGARAVTFGHAVLARTAADLAGTRNHERVHVRQYERWGVFFVPAYVLMWLVLWFRGFHPYFDNPFEREAFDQAP